ncbi:MAG: hypothetical protein KDG89_03515 [Geminicoccaceae bacterium]|nr:hypothetical protein [Geminicoccaceae bacterium]
MIAALQRRDDGVDRRPAPREVALGGRDREGPQRLGPPEQRQHLAQEGVRLAVLPLDRRQPVGDPLKPCVHADAERLKLAQERHDQLRLGRRALRQVRQVGLRLAARDPLQPLAGDGLAPQPPQGSRGPGEQPVAAGAAADDPQGTPGPVGRQPLREVADHRVGRLLRRPEHEPAEQRIHAGVPRHVRRQFRPHAAPVRQPELAAQRLAERPQQFNGRRLRRKIPRPAPHDALPFLSLRATAAREPHNRRLGKVGTTARGRAAAYPCNTRASAITAPTMTSV